MNRVGLMGGTFDPIHLGHLAAAEAARASFSLEQVIFVPVGIPPHKNGEITASVHRLEMVKIAIQDRPYFEVSDFEIKRPGKSYTIDTVRYFKRVLDEGEIYFITGADAILEILSWKAVTELMNICNFIAVTRPGYAANGLEREIKNLPPFVRNRVNVLEVQGLNISSTAVRSKVKNDESIEALVPKKVIDYIKNQRLYQSK